MHYCPKCGSMALLLHKTFHALVLSDYLHCRASGTALVKKLVWIYYSTWMKSSLSLLTATFCLLVLPFFLLAGHSWKTAFWLHLERVFQTKYIGISLVVPLQQEHIDGKKQSSEFSSSFKDVINLFIAVRMKNSKSSCPAEHFPKHSSDLRAYFLQTSSQPWTPNSLGHFTKWDWCAEVVRGNYWSTTKHFWWCLRAWAIPAKVSFLKNQWVL